MSYDDNNIKSRCSQIYFHSIYREIKRKETKKSNNLYSSRNNKIESKISFQRRKKKQLTIGPLSSTLESTLTSSKRQNSKRQNEEENFNLSSEKITIKSKRLLQPKDEDMRFLFDILYTNNQDNIRQTQRQTTISSYINKSKNNEASDQNKSYKFYDLSGIKRYLIKTQKKYNVIGNINISHKDKYNNNKSSENIMDSYQMQKLEDLIARYSLIIFIYLRCGRINEAKVIFLVMIKENIKNMIKIENLLVSIYKTINRRINIHKDVPKLTYQLAKIYSFIIKYSQLFNLTNYRNIFLDKYFQIQHLNYNFYMLKGTTRGFSSETRNQIRYWFSYCLHNAMFYTIYNRFPTKIPIICNYNIYCLYKNREDTSLTDSEKSLSIKTAYNQGILFYVNNQREEALLCLKYAKEKINSYSEDYANNGIKNKKSTVNYVKKPKKEEIHEIKKNYKDRNKKLKKNKSIILDKDTLRFTKKDSINDLSLRGFEIKKKESKDMSVPKNQYDVLKTKIYKDFKKEQISINDIEQLIKFGKERGLLNEEPVTGFKGLDFLFKYKESYNCIKKKLALSKGFRGSHIDFHTTIKMKDFFIPEKFKNPLLRKIELFMGIIELDKKNFQAAYEHIINALYIVFLLKLSGNSNYNKDFYDKQKIELNEYFQLIEDLYDKEIKYRQQLERSSSKSLLTSNDRKSLMNTSVMSSLNLNNSLYRSSFIIFENKAAENHFYKNHLNSKENNNELQSNNNLSENDKKLIKEFEKFFIFLNHLSVYQIKILNETQPDNEKRNHLPLMFSDQFKDSLNRFQRIELDNVQTMALSRFMVLKDPNRWIVPTNLNYLLIKKSQSMPKDKSHIYRSSLDRYEYFDDTFMKTTEYKNYLKIVNSEKATPEIIDFLKRNRKYVIKIIKQSSELELNNIIKYPYIIIEPIKKYKRKTKKEIPYSRNKKLDLGKRPQTMTHSFASKMMMNGRNSNNRYNFHKVNSNDFSRSKGKRNKSENANFLYNKKNDTTHNNRNNRNYMKNMDKKCLTTNSNNNDIYEESFEDYLLSPEFSSLSNE